MIRREDFFAAGGLRGDLYPGGYFEDVDLCQKVKRDIGKDIWYCAEASLVHTVASTGGNPKHFMRNSSTFHKRWDAEITPDTNIVYVGY
jgi:GT2 family glycosyltransferase